MVAKNWLCVCFMKAKKHIPQLIHGTSIGNSTDPFMGSMANGKTRIKIQTYLHGIPCIHLGEWLKNPNISGASNQNNTWCHNPGSQEDLPSDGGFHEDLTQIFPTTRVQPAQLAGSEPC